MHGPEDGDSLRRGEQATSPSHGLERGAMEVATAAIALPASDRQKKIDASLIGHASELEAIRPTREPALGHQRRSACRRAIRPEEADLQRIGVVHLAAIAQRCVLNRQ